MSETLPESSYDPLAEGKKLRISKSSYMTFKMCERKYWWQYIQLRDIEIPATPAMTRGKYVHAGLEDCYENWEGQHNLLPLFPTDDPAFDTIAELEQARMEEWGIENWKPVEFEVKREVYDPELDAVLVGFIDAVLQHPDGGLCIFELKTGNMGDSKLSRTRKELCYYTYLLRLMGETRPITHFAYLSPDCDHLDFITKVMNQRNKEVMLGTDRGVLIIEKVNQRSINNFNKEFPETVQRMKESEWPMTWNDYFCPQWCDFHDSCSNEIMGFDDVLY